MYEIQKKNTKSSFYVLSITSGTKKCGRHEELHQFTKDNLLELVPRPENHNIIKTNWIFKKKSDEHGVIIQNNARLVAQGYIQIEGIYFDIACHLNVRFY